VRHGCAAAADVAQAGQVEFGQLGAGQEVDHHGRDVGPVRDLVARDQPAGHLAVPARQHHHGRAHVDRHVHAVLHAGHVEHRDDRQDHALHRGLRPDAAAQDVVHDRAVRVHAALGEAGGARGVRHHCQVVRAGGVRAGGAALREHVGPRHGAGLGRVRCGDPRGRGVFGVFVLGGQRVGVGRDQQVLHALRFGQLDVGGRHIGGEIRAADDRGGAGIGNVVLELLGPVHRVDRHHHRIGAQDAVVRSDELRAVLHVQQHALTLLHARHLLQPAGHGQRVVMQLAVGGVATVEEDRVLVRIASRRHFQVEPQARLRRADVVRQAPGPELEVRSCHAMSPWNRLLFLPDGIRTIVLFSTVARTQIF